MASAGTGLGRTRTPGAPLSSAALEEPVFLVAKGQGQRESEKNKVKNFRRNSLVCIGSICFLVYLALSEFQVSQKEMVLFLDKTIHAPNSVWLLSEAPLPTPSWASRTPSEGTEPTAA